MRPLMPLALALLCAVVGCSKPKIERVTWPVMGTVAALEWKGSVNTQDLERTQAVFAEIERLLNAHNPQSELSRLAGLSDDEILKRCDVKVRECYRAAFRLRDETQGLFNPRWRGPATLDLGAIAKGYAVDLAAIDDGLVDLGGNLKAGRGTWQVGIAGGESFTLEPGAACATSAEYFRGQHIRDGLTGAALSNRVYSVTVVHPSSAMLADGLSTVMFLMGRERGEQFLRDHYPEARVFWIDEEQ